MPEPQEHWFDHEKLEVYRESIAFIAWCGVIDRDRPGTYCLTKFSPPPNRARDGLLFPIEGVRRHVQGRMKSRR